MIFFYEKGLIGQILRPLDCRCRFFCHLPNHVSQFLVVIK